MFHYKIGFKFHKVVKHERTLERIMLTPRIGKGPCRLQTIVAEEMALSKRATG